MSYRFDSTPLIAGAYMWGNRGHGVLAEEIPSTGEYGPAYLYPSLEFPADNGKEVRGEIVSWPSAGNLVADEYTRFEFTDAPDGTYYFDVQVYEDGAAVGSPVTFELIVGGSTVEAAALYSNISSMLSGKIGTLNASVDISSGYTDVDAGDVNYNVFSNFNTVTNYSSPSGSIVEVSTTFSTSSDMGNAPVSDVISLVDFNTILNSTSLANITANATLVNNIQSGFVVDRDCILNDSILFNVSSNYISTTGDTGVSAIAAITSAYSMLAGNYALTGAGISSVLSSIAQSVGISNKFAGIVDANNVSVLASGGQTNSSNCSFSLSSSDASISSISIEAIADYSTSLNLLCAVVSNMEASADYMSVANLISSNLSILNAQSSFGISSDLSVTRTMTTSTGATISVTCGYTTSGIQFTSTEVLTPDSRMVRVLSEGRIIRVLA